MERVVNALRATTAMLILALVPASATAEWTHWRGPHQTGVADAEGLISNWSKDGENLIWRSDFTGRSTPVVVDGRVCANGRAGEDINRQEVVACWNAETGAKLWQRQFNVYHTAVPWNRVGWGDVAADSETGNVYAQLVNGRLVALAPDGSLAWEWRLGEDFGRFSGYGGRTNTPVVDEDRVIAHVISASFGSHRGGGDRWVAFDKRTGDILWVSEKGSTLKDLNTYSSPVVATIDGRRQMIAGGADGWLYGLDARTGESLWKFHLSQRGLNSSVVVDGSKVIASHSEENIDTGLMGRVVAIDVAGASGDLTGKKELWRVEGLQAGYVSPAVRDGRVYIADNSANLFALNAETGEEHWVVNYGTVGKASPVLAGDLIYITEVNGNVRIIRNEKDSASVISEVHLEVPDGRYAEIYSSPAIAYNRIYFTTEEGIYCLGDDSSSFSAGEPAAAAAAVKGQGPAARLQVVPAVVVADHTESHDLSVFAFDAKGRPLGQVEAKFELSGLAGQVSADGKVSFDGSKIAGIRNGQVKATVGELSAVSDFRITGPLPWSFDFDDAPTDKPPAGWAGVGKGAAVIATEADGNIVRQPKAPRGAPRATMLFGTSSMKGYTIQADVKGNAKGRRMTDVGVVNQGYTMDLQGAHQRIQIQSWTSERRMRQTFPFEWEIGTWYTIKMRVDLEGSGDSQKAVIRGKAWKRGEAEPNDWTVTVEDPLPIDSGSPGLYTFAPVESYFDNVLVTVSQ